jgi:hypothetical protein
MSSTADIAVIWSLFGISAVEIGSILFFTHDNLLKSTEFQFVHKDNYIVFYVTFIIICLIFKLVVLGSLQ